MRRIIMVYRLGCVVGIMMLITLAGWPGQVYAQEPWPPFWFDVNPAYTDGRITYSIAVYTRVDWPIADFTIKFPLPPQTRFLEANAPAGVTTTFDGREVTFFTTTVNRYLEGLTLTVLVADPTTSVFTTQPWLSWKGKQPGDYLADPVSMDTSQQPLNWTAPSPARLQVQAGALVSAGTITYTIYPKAVGRQHMLNLNLSVPLPAGTTFLAAGAPPPFTAGFDGQSIAFSTAELPRQSETGPLTFQVAPVGAAGPLISTTLWAAWKNGPVDAPPLEPTAPAEEQLALVLNVAQPQWPQQVLFDPAGDVPFAHYDLTGIALARQGSRLQVILQTAGPVAPTGQPVDYTLLVNSDCDSTTGQVAKVSGAEYRVSYSAKSGRATITSWDNQQQDWRWSDMSPLTSQVMGQAVIISLSPGSISQSGSFCWLAEATDNTTAFNPQPPHDRVPDEANPQLTRYDGGPVVAGSEPRGQLAVPLRNTKGTQDIWILGLPGGDIRDKIAQARQPKFSDDGRKLFFKIESGDMKQTESYPLPGGRVITYALKYYGGDETVYEYDLLTGTDQPASSDAPYPPEPALAAPDIVAGVRGSLVTFSSPREGNWEAYVMNEDGSNIRNLSNSPTSTDGLPTLSPDGAWAAFVSDRTGRWAIWIAPVTGTGPAEKLFDLPVQPPWGEGEQAWTAQRMAWGPE